MSNHALPASNSSTNGRKSILFGVLPKSVLAHLALRLEPLTHAALPVRGGLVPGVTGTLEGSCHVDALTVPAQVFTQLALVHV